MDSKISHAIKLLRFPLAFMVVVWHCNFVSGDLTQLPILNFISTLFAGVIVKCSVPCFFVMAGYLFFHNIDALDLKIYKRKLKSRGKSLFIPYICWISILLLVYLAVSLVTNGNLGGDDTKSITEFTTLDYLFAYISGAPIYKGTSYLHALLTGAEYPLLIPLWFVRDLMVCVLFSPAIWLIIKRLSHSWGGVFLVCALLSIAFWTYYVSYLVSILWFSCGAFLSIKHVSLSSLRGKYIIVGLYLLAALIGTIFAGQLTKIYYLSTNILGIVSFFIIALYFSDKRYKIPAILIDSTFFVYASHFIIVQPTCSRLSSLLPHNDIILTIVYIIYPIVMTTICICCFALLQKIFPRLTSVLCGNRTKARDNYMLRQI